MECRRTSGVEGAARGVLTLEVIVVSWSCAMTFDQPSRDDERISGQTEEFRVEPYRRTREMRNCICLNSSNRLSNS